MKNIFKLLLAFTIGAFMAVSCSEEEELLGTKISADASILLFDGQGASSQTVSIVSDGDWIAVAPEWVTVTPNFGTGNQTVQISVADNLDADGTLAAERKAAVAFTVTGGSYAVAISQAGDPDKKPAEIAKITVAQFNAAEENDAVFYELTGAITSIANTYYGNFYLADETGSVYVYGLYDQLGGNYGAFEKYGLNQGDIITIRGYRGSYNGLIEVMGGYYVSHVASLVSATPAEVELPIEGGEFEVALAYKGETFEININPEARGWLNMGTIRPDGDTTRITFSAPANNGSPREATISFTSSKGSTVSTVETKVKQEGSIIDATVADFLAQEVSDVALYRLTGKVKSIAGAEYGNFYLEDASGEVYVYGLTATPVEKNDKSFASLGIKVGDIVTLVGTRADFKGTAQVGGPAYYISHVSHKEATVAEVLAASTGDDYYKITGTISNIKSTEYGNFDITDETGTIYVYGLTKAPVEKNDKSFASLGLKEGDIVTLVGKRAEFKGSAQVGSAYYLYHQEGTTDPEEEVINEVSIADFNAAAEDDTWYKISGVVVSVANTTYGNLTIKDASGEVYVYGLRAEKGGSNKVFETLNVKEGDILTIIANRGSYNSQIQASNAYMDSNISVKSVTVEDFLAAPVGDAYYRLTGTVENLKNTEYGNFDIKDATGSVYVYGLLTGWKGASKKFESLEIVEGNNITIIGMRAAYNDSPQVGSAFLVSKN